MTRKYRLKRYIFAYACMAFTAGVFVFTFIPVPAWLVWWVVVFFCTAMLLVGIAPRTQKVFASIFCLSLLASFGLGGMRVSSAQRSSEFARYYNQRIETKALVVDTQKDKLVIKPAGFSQKLLVNAPKDRAYVYGDEVLFRGVIVELQNFNSDFDYVHYLQKDGIYAEGKTTELWVLDRNQGNSIKSVLLRVRDWFARSLVSHMSEQDAGFVMSLLFGDKSGLDKSLAIMFTLTGLGHIIAVSGFNVSIFTKQLEFVRSLCGKWVYISVAVTLLVGFVIVSGSSSSVVRAAIMAGVLLLSLASTRLYNSLMSLGLACFVMLVYNPLYLVYDVGFQLSAAATFGIAYVGVVTAELPYAFLKKGWWQNIQTSLTACAFTLPLSLVIFGGLPVYGIVANIIVLPCVPLLMLFGFISGFPLVGLGAGFITHILALCMLWVVDFFASLPHAIVPARISWYTATVSYVVLITSIVIFRQIYGKIYHKP